MKKRVFIQPGDKFGRLTAVRYMYTGKHWRRHFLFKCDCGSEKILQAANVSSGNTKSCGCLSSEVKHSKRMPNQQGVVNHLILQYKRHARNRQLSFSLKPEQFRILLEQPCFYCGLPPSNIKYTKNCKEGFTYSGIDRVNPDKGYESDNVVPCCVLCNKAKNHLNLNEFSEWVKRLEAMAEQWG